MPVIVVEKILFWAKFFRKFRFLSACLEIFSILVKKKISMLVKTLS